MNHSSTTPSTCPRFVGGKPVWPEGVPAQVKKSFGNFSTRATNTSSTVGDLQSWYFTACKQFEIQGKQLKYNISQKKKKQRKLLNDLANASAEEQSRLIKFHKVGMDAEYDYAKVAKDIAEHVKQFEEDQASLPRHLTFHSSMESKRLTAAQASTDAAAVKCTFKDCIRAADMQIVSSTRILQRVLCQKLDVATQGISYGKTVLAMQEKRAR